MIYLYMELIFQQKYKLPHPKGLISLRFINICCIQGIEYLKRTASKKSVLLKKNRNMQHLIDRFMSYIAIDTQSDPNSDTTPSTKKQWTLAHKLVLELKEIGMQDVTIDENAYIMATLPANIDREVPTIGFISHFDTSPDFTAAQVKPQIIRNYDGEDIILNKERNIVLSPDFFEDLLQYKGNTIITTDGTTLLGADDKAGIAEIVTLAQELLESDQPHATVRIAITPDEEIGRGADRFDVAKFGADFAYTVDGGGLGEIEFENFNAAGAKVEFTGLNIHPGSAKDKMVNSQLIAMEFQSLLPIHQRPECTEGYEGFFHLIGMEGCVEQTTLRYIVRDHDMEKFLQKKEIMEKITCFLNEKYGFGVVELKLTDSYFNMREQI